MKIKELIEELNLVVFNTGDIEKDVNSGYTSDLLSDVMGNAEAGCIWITLQTHRNVAAISALKEIGAVVFVKGNTPDDNTLENAKEEGITLLGTSEESFDISGKIYALINA